jgi:hypothetical protein
LAVLDDFFTLSAYVRISPRRCQLALFLLENPDLFFAAALMYDNTIS